MILGLSHTCDLKKLVVKGHLGVNDLWFQVFADMGSNLILQRMQKYVIVKVGETPGSRTAFFFFFFTFENH